MKNTVKQNLFKVTRMVFARIKFKPYEESM